jgi:hypothetical protein
MEVTPLMEDVEEVILLKWSICVQPPFAEMGKNTVLTQKIIAY